MRTERKRRGWSQRKAAERAGIDDGMWSRIERGLQPISDRTRAGVASAFDWPLDWPDVGEDHAVSSVSQLDELDRRVQALESLVTALIRAMLDDRERAALAQQVAERRSQTGEQRHLT